MFSWHAMLGYLYYNPFFQLFSFYTHSTLIRQIERTPPPSIPAVGRAWRQWTGDLLVEQLKLHLSPYGCKIMTNKLNREPTPHAVVVRKMGKLVRQLQTDLQLSKHQIGKKGWCWTIDRQGLEYGYNWRLKSHSKKERKLKTTLLGLFYSPIPRYAPSTPSKSL